MLAVGSMQLAVGSWRYAVPVSCGLYPVSCFPLSQGRLGGSVPRTRHPPICSIGSLACNHPCHPRSSVASYLLWVPSSIIGPAASVIALALSGKGRCRTLRRAFVLPKHFPDGGGRNTSLIHQCLQLHGKLLHLVRRLGDVPGQANLS